MRYVGIFDGYVLQEVEKEQGDTWIYGVQQDLYKTAAFRAIMRARRACLTALGAQKCSGHATPHLSNATRFALKLGEHTWGFNWGYLDQRHYNNDDLAFAIENVGGFAKAQEGWVEQRAYVTHVVNALAEGAASGDAAAAWLHARTVKELAVLRQRQGADLTQWEEVSPSAPVSTPHFRSILWNTTAGGLASIVGKGGHDFAREKGGLAQYQYQTLNEDDFWVFMNATLKVHREVAFGKANLSANADVVSRFWTGKLAKVFRHTATSEDTDGVDSYLQLVEMAEVPHTQYGAPSRVWTRFDFWRNTSRIDVTLSWENKTRTRLPEAHWFTLQVVPPSQPAAGSGSGCDTWVVSKLNSSFCATDVDLFGATHAHAVSEEGGIRWTESGTVALRTLDAALVSLEFEDALPDPVNRTIDDGAAGRSAYVCLSNNFWTTNYPNWQPFTTGIGDEDAVFRFELELADGRDGR